MADDRTVTLHNVTAVKKSKLALLCVIDGDEVWVPDSQIHDDSEVSEQGHEGKLVVTKWWAEKNGYEDDGGDSADAFASKFRNRVRG